MNVEDVLKLTNEIMDKKYHGSVYSRQIKALAEAICIKVNEELEEIRNKKE
jgi:hypothetical protein